MRPRAVSAIVALAVLAGLLLAGWLLPPWLQSRRADSLLADANSHIAAANQLLTQARIDYLDKEGLSSPESIGRAQQGIGNTIPVIEAVFAETEQAYRDAARAAALPLLPQEYRNYLSKKSGIAELRVQQLNALKETLERLQKLYDSGALIFTALADIDRLLGQIEIANSQIRSSPGEAKASLSAASQTLLTMQKQLEDRYQQTGFELLKRLAANAQTDAEVAGLSAQLAAASAAGNQAQAQQLAGRIDAKIATVVDSRSEFDRWWQVEIEPFKQLYDQLQSRQQELDAEAAALYPNR